MSAAAVAGAPPRAPSAALLGVLWAAFAAALVTGAWAHTHGYGETPLPTVSAAPTGWSFAETGSRTNAAGERVQIGYLSEDAEPTVHNAAAKVGDRWLTLDSDFDGGSFDCLLVAPEGRRWLLVESFNTEAMGDLQLLASEDGGRTFVRRATVAWPTYVANLDEVRFDGERVEVFLSLDEDAQLSQPYWGLWDELRERIDSDTHVWPTLPAGHYVLRSKDGGRSFGRLQRVG